MLDNKGPIAWEQIGKTPSWKRTRYVNIRFKRLIDIIVGKINPMVFKWLLVRLMCEE